MQVRVREAEDLWVAEFTRPGKPLMYAKGVLHTGKLPRTEYYYTKNIPPMEGVEMHVGHDGLLLLSFPYHGCTHSCTLRPFKLEIALAGELQEFCSL